MGDLITRAGCLNHIDDFLPGRYWVFTWHQTTVNLQDHSIRNEVDTGASMDGSNA